MKHLLITLTILTAVTGCKKDEMPANDQLESTEGVSYSYIVDSPGSYFIYEWYEKDSTGQEISLGITDSTYIAGDTTINGNTFVHIKGTYMGSSSSWFLRDSSYFIINHYGEIQWTQSQIQDTLGVNYINPNIVVYSIYNPGGIFDYPEGTWNGNTIIGQTGVAYDLQSHYYYTNGSPFTVCDSFWISHKLFADGIGEVLSQTAFTSQLQSECKYRERRLTYYFIAE